MCIDRIQGFDNLKPLMNEYFFTVHFNNVPFRYNLHRQSGTNPIAFNQKGADFSGIVFPLKNSCIKDVSSSQF